MFGSQPQRSAEELEPQQAREQVAHVARSLAANGLVLGSAGNVSARAGELIAVTPMGARLQSLEASQVALVDADGHQVDGELEPTSELGLHLGIYRRFDAGAVVHTHSTLATALACVLQDELPVVHYYMLALGGSVRVAPYRTFGSPELAQVTIEALQDRRAALMANHGAIVHAACAQDALERALVLEWCCELYWRASLIGTPRTLDDNALREVAAQIERIGYGSPRPRRTAGVPRRHAGGAAGGPPRLREPAPEGESPT
jgi:L-fuculose-phosphate aldolase